MYILLIFIVLTHIAGPMHFLNFKKQTLIPKYLKLHCELAYKYKVILLMVPNFILKKNGLYFKKVHFILMKIVKSYFTNNIFLVFVKSPDVNL